MLAQTSSAKQSFFGLGFTSKLPLFLLVLYYSNIKPTGLTLIVQHLANVFIGT